MSVWSDSCLLPLPPPQEKKERDWSLLSSLSHKKCGQGFNKTHMKVTPVRAASAGFKNDSLGVSNDTIFIIVCSISMKYSEAMNPDKGVRSTRCAHWCRRYCWWQQVCSIYAGKHAHIQPSFSLTCPAFSLTHTWKNGRVCVCLPHALWSPATRLVCSSAVTPRCYRSSAMLNRPSSTQTHTGCQLAPSDMAKTMVRGGSGLL